MKKYKIIEEKNSIVNLTNQAKFIIRVFAWTLTLICLPNISTFVTKQSWRSVFAIRQDCIAR
ncbi:MAG: hypothetical protein LBC68_00380 [Prevotellaceae bacterium]|nr:hypothetical protein [Prevotellaceae bacterium]